MRTIALFALLMPAILWAGTDNPPPKADVFFSWKLAPLADGNFCCVARRNLMGTPVEVTVIASTPEACGRASEVAFLEVKRIEDLMTTWREDTELQRVNQQAGKSAVTVGEDIAIVLEEAIRLGTVSGGALDVTFQPIWKLWKAHAGGRYPTQIEIGAAKSLVDYRLIKFDKAKRKVRLAKQGMSIDLGAIAKGYAVDRALHVLRELGVRHALVNAGGDLRAYGRRGDRPWIIGIRHPRKEDAVIADLPVQDEAIVTSGDYERYLEIGGKKYAHIVDPRTGIPAAKLISVTVIAPTAMTADGLATAIFVLGAEKGIELAESQPNTEAIVIDGQGKMFMTTGMKSKD